MSVRSDSSSSSPQPEAPAAKVMLPSISPGLAHQGAPGLTLSCRSSRTAPDVLCPPDLLYPGLPGASPQVPQEAAVSPDLTDSARRFPFPFHSLCSRRASIPSLNSPATTASLCCCLTNPVYSEPLPLLPRPLSLQFIQMLQPRQNNLLARLLNLARQKDLVEDRVDLVKVEDEVELAHVAEEGVEHLDKEVDGLEVRQLVVVGVDARAEKEPRVPPVDELVVAELDEVGLVLLVARGDEAVDLLKRESENVGVVWEGGWKWRFTSPLSLIFSSSL